MAISDDTAQIRRTLGIISEPFLDYLLALFDESGLGFLGANDVIWGNASLPQVDHFAPQNAAGSNVNVAIVSDVDWTFATQLQSARSQVLICSSMNNTTYSRGTRVENVIKAFFEQIGRFFHTPNDNPREIFG